MSFIFGNNYIVIPLFGVIVFVISYLNADRFIEFLYKRTLGQREEIIQLLRSQYIETDEKKVFISLLLLSFGLGAVAFLAFWPNIMAGLLFGTSVGLAGWTLPKIILKGMWDKYCNRVVDQMVDGLTIMTNGLKAGLGLTQCLERVVVNMSGPLAQEFTVVLNQIRLSRTPEAALIEFGERIPRPDVQMFVTSVSILKETGGNLSETFTTIVNTVRERQKIEKKIDAMTSQATMQAIIVTLVPFALMVMFLVVDPAFIMPLFTKPLGWFALILMIGLQVMGGVMMKKIVTIKV